MAVKNQKKEEDLGFAFHKENYLLLIAGLILIAAGFLLMLGGGSDDRSDGYQQARVKYIWFSE